MEWFYFALLLAVPNVCGEAAARLHSIEFLFFFLPLCKSGGFGGLSRDFDEVGTFFFGIEKGKNMVMG